MTIMADVYTLGGTTIGAGINAISNGVMSWYNNKEAQKREEQARYENYLYNEKAAVNADRRTRALYEDFYSPQAQMQQIKDAGLSPSIFFGDAGGVTGQAGAQGAGAAGIQPTTYGMPPIDMAMMAKALSETKLNEAKANEINGENERGRAEIDQIYQETATKLSEQHLNEASEAVQNSLTCINEIEAQLKNETFWANVAHVEAEIKNLDAQTNDLIQAANIKGVEYKFNIETYNERVDQFKEKGVKLGMEVLNIQKNTEKYEAEIKGIYEHIAQEWGRIDLENQETEAKVRDIESIMKDRYIRRGYEQIRLQLMRDGIEYEHADRQCQMLVSFLNNLIATAGTLAGGK